MDPNQEKEEYDLSIDTVEEQDTDEAGSVDDFIRELEAKEKDLHITAETTFIEIAADFENEDEVPDFLRQELSANTTKTVKPSAPAAADGPRVKQLEAEIAALKAKVAGLEQERSELFKDSQRRAKDFEAYKARTERERRETFQRQLSNLATQMLPALDNLDRALQCTPHTGDEKNKEFAHFYDGVVLVNQQVNEVLAGMGIVPIATVGEEFDPHLHEAVAVDENSGHPDNTITAELLRGFRIGDHVIRHSMVKVAKSAGHEAVPAAAPAKPNSHAAPETGEDDRDDTALVIERNGIDIALEDDE